MYASLLHEAWTHQLEIWHEFYLLVGTAGVALTGLLFVIVSLGPRVIADRQATGVRAFSYLDGRREAIAQWLKALRAPKRSATAFLPSP